MSSSNPPMNEVNQVAAAVVASATTPAPQPSSKKYFASIYPGEGMEIDSNFAAAVVKLEELLGMDIWVIVQNGPDEQPWSSIAQLLFQGFSGVRDEMSASKPTALLIESNGGDAHAAFRIGRMFQRRCKAMTSIIPNFAKSAATLMALCASSFIFGRDAELGPLDVQMFDTEREEWSSALNAVQSVERMNAFSMSAIDQLVPLLKRKSGKRLDVLLPLTLTYMTNFLRPMLEKIDTVDFTKKSRELKVAEEYAIRLMRTNYTIVAAERIARALVENYPAHEFAIDADESGNYYPLSKTRTYGLGLRTTSLSAEATAALEAVAIMSPTTDNVVGRIREVR